MKKKPKSKKKVSPKKSRGSGFSFYSLLPFLIGMIVFAADQFSKYLVYHGIPRMSHEAQWYPYNGIGLFENFFGVEGSIVHAVNYGAAWGMFSNFQLPLLILRILLIMSLCAYLIVYNQNKKLLIPFVFVIVGAVGNILDYFVYGHVIDMFRLVLWGYDYPVFNIADSSIFVGVTLLILIPWCQNRGLMSCKT
jgi:signal peptidase II